MTNKEIQILVADLYAKIKALNEVINKDTPPSKTQGLFATVDKSFVAFNTEHGDIVINNERGSNDDEDQVS